MPANWILSAILGALSLLHVYWACGGERGFASSLPRTTAGEPLFRPGAAACSVVALALAAAAGLAVWSTFRFHALAIYGIAVAFALRAVGDFRYVRWSRRVHGTDFARLDTWLYSPLCLLLALLAWPR
jgi:hypothetical protein